MHVQVLSKLGHACGRDISARASESVPLLAPDLHRWDLSNSTATSARMDMDHTVVIEEFEIAHEDDAALEPAKKASSVHNRDEAPPFGSRYLMVSIHAEYPSSCSFARGRMKTMCSPKMLGEQVAVVYRVCGINAFEQVRMLSARRRHHRTVHRDHVPAPEGYDDFVNAALERQKQKPVSDFEKTKVCGPGMAARHWDIFYKNNQVCYICPWWYFY